MRTTCPKCGHEYALVVVRKDAPTGAEVLALEVHGETLSEYRLRRLRGLRKPREVDKPIDGRVEEPNASPKME